MRRLRNAVRLPAESLGRDPVGTTCHVLSPELEQIMAECARLDAIVHFYERRVQRGLDRNIALLAESTYRPTGVLHLTGDVAPLAAPPTPRKEVA